MSDHDELPELVGRRDGSTEPFEPERITRALFAAGDRAGRADAFLARELTEGVLHFLAAEGESSTSAEQIAEVVAKVVRELGQPAIARAYEERGPSVPRVATPPAIYPRELISAHQEGLIRLTGLDTPNELAGLVVDPSSAAVLAARPVVGEYVAIDGPEFEDIEPGAFIDELQSVCASTGLTAILNLNGSIPPRRAPSAGPLFEGGESTPRRPELSLDFAERAVSAGLPVWWHLVEADLDDLTRLEPVILMALLNPAVEFVFDRSKSPIALGPGLDRTTPAVLTQVGVNVGRLVEHLGGPPLDPDTFLRKVASLTRFAKTAGHAKLDHLRHNGPPELRAAFLLDRARLVLVPMGFEKAASATERSPAEFGREVLSAIRVAAETDRPRVLPVRVDSPLGDWGGTFAGSLSHRGGMKLANGGRFAVQIGSDIEAIEVLGLAMSQAVGRVSFINDKTIK